MGVYSHVGFEHLKTVISAVCGMNFISNALVGIHSTSRVSLFCEKHRFVFGKLYLGIWNSVNVWPHRYKRYGLTVFIGVKITMRLLLLLNGGGFSYQLKEVIAIRRTIRSDVGNSKRSAQR